MKSKKIMYLWTLYKFTDIYFSSLQTPIKSTFSGQCIIRSDIYKSTLEIFIPSIYISMNCNSLQHRKQRIITLFLLSLKMTNCLTTSLHISGFFNMCYLTYNKIVDLFFLKRLYILCGINFMILSIMRKLKIINKIIFNKLYLTNELIVAYIMNYVMWIERN
jgi:hypothetical protein